MLTKCDIDSDKNIFGRNEMGGGRSNYRSIGYYVFTLLLSPITTVHKRQ